MDYLRHLQSSLDSINERIRGIEATAGKFFMGPPGVTEEVLKTLKYTRDRVIAEIALHEREEKGVGTYTELHLNVELSSSTPPAVIDMLRYMTMESLECPDKTDILFCHPLFNCPAWDSMLVGTSAYFPMKTNSTVYQDGDNWNVSIRCNFQQKDRECEKLAWWLTPFMDATEGDFLGYYRDEYKKPTLIIASRFNNAS